MGWQRQHSYTERWLASWRSKHRRNSVVLLLAWRKWTLRPVYSDTTQLNSTRRRVELSWVASDKSGLVVLYKSTAVQQFSDLTASSDCPPVCQSLSVRHLHAPPTPPAPHRMQRIVTPQGSKAWYITWHYQCILFILLLVDLQVILSVLLLLQSLSFWYWNKRSYTMLFV